MLKKSLGLLVVAGGLLAGSTSAVAHHAFAAEFDADKPINIEGTVTKYRRVNPHSWLYFDVKNADGTVTNWGVEFGAPNALDGRGLKKDDIQVGDPIKIKGYRSKNGGPFGYSVEATLKDGRTVKTGGAQDSPTAATTPAAQQ